jgi:putative SOS response-associated peptidase YedK
MCGRFAVSKKPEDIAAEVLAEWDDVPEGIPSWNTCPTSLSPVLVDDKLHCWSWGLIPSWSRDDKKRAGLINARIESLQEKASFKSLINSKQCIVPCNGYFEWSCEGNSKIPYYIHSEGPQMLLMAGLWDLWHDLEGNPVNSFTIITKEATEAIEKVHSRMPVLLDLKKAKEWSRNELTVDDLIDCSLSNLVYHQVSTEVNSVRNNKPELILPTTKPQFWQQDLF